MTSDQIIELTRTHIAQRDLAKAMLDKYYAEFERRGELEEWTNRYLFHKKTVEALNREIPDDI